MYVYDKQIPLANPNRLFEYFQLVSHVLYLSSCHINYLYIYFQLVLHILCLSSCHRINLCASKKAFRMISNSSTLLEAYLKQECIMALSMSLYRINNSFS